MFANTKKIKTIIVTSKLTQNDKLYRMRTKNCMLINKTKNYETDKMIATNRVYHPLLLKL